jgi:hypothetical protein
MNFSRRCFFSVIVLCPPFAEYARILCFVETVEKAVESVQNPHGAGISVTILS